MWARGMTAGPWTCMGFMALKHLMPWTEGKHLSLAVDQCAYEHDDPSVEGGAYGLVPKRCMQAAIWCLLPALVGVTHTCTDAKS